MMGIDDLKTFLLTPIAQVGLIIGLAEIIKRFGLESRFIPLVDIGLGLISGIEIYSSGLGYPISEGVLIGVALGLEACGLFSGCKNLFQ